MAVEAALHHRQLNLHSSSRSRVARLTTHRRILRGGLAHRPGMAVVSKPKIGSWWTGRRLPVYPLLHRSIMAIGTCARSRPEWPIRLQHPGMATDAAGEEVPMSPGSEG